MGNFIIPIFRGFYLRENMGLCSNTRFFPGWAAHEQALNFGSAALAGFADRVSKRFVLSCNGGSDLGFFALAVPEDEDREEDQELGR